MKNAQLSTPIIEVSKLCDKIEDSYKLMNDSLTILRILEVTL